MGGWDEPIGLFIIYKNMERKFIILKQTISAVVIALLTLIGLSYFGVMNTMRVDAGSVGGAYTYKNYTSTAASSTARTLVKGGAGELGYVTINQTGSQIIRLFDGASTSAATSTLTPIAVIKATTTEGTLKYEVNVLQGIVAEFPVGFAGNVTFSVR